MVFDNVFRITMSLPNNFPPPKKKKNTVCQDVSEKIDNPVGDRLGRIRRILRLNFANFYFALCFII